MNRRSLLAAAVGAVTACFASIARALPAARDSKFTMSGDGHDHQKYPSLTHTLRFHERVNVMDAKEGDEDYDDSELRDALTVLGKYGFKGVVLPSLFTGWPEQITKSRVEDLAQSRIQLYVNDDQTEDIAFVLGKKIKRLQIQFWTPPKQGD